LLPSGTFASRFEQAFNDRFRGRNLLLLIDHTAVAGLFRTSPVSNVLLGRDGWLYWLGEDGRSLDRNFRGAFAVQDAQLMAVAAEIKRRNDFLATHGIAHVVTIVPEKFTVYPEFLPPWVVREPSPTPLARLAALLARQGDVRYVDLVGPLRRAKDSAPLYYRTDSHWNLLGASIGYEHIMREVQRALPAGRVSSIAPPARPAFVPGLDWYSGDLARLIGVPFLYREPDIAPFAKVMADASGRCAKRIDDGKDPELEVYACSRPGLPRAVVYRDSMAIPLIPLLSENFARIVYAANRHFDPKLIEHERPDVVIEEFVERILLAPAASPM
jgi:alginate O-acetyltransferase complex protein AlgJ